MKGLGWSETRHIVFGMSGRREKRSEVDREEFGVARNEAYGLMCQARKKVMTIVQGGGGQGGGYPPPPSPNFRLQYKGVPKSPLLSLFCNSVYWLKPHSNVNSRPPNLAVLPPPVVYEHTEESDEVML